MTQIVVDIGGTGYNWYRYTEPLEVLNWRDVSNASWNALVIATALRGYGYNIGNVSLSNANYDTQLVEIVDKLNAVEHNLDVLNDPTIMSAFYGESVRKNAGETAHNKAEIWRWFQILEDMLEIVQGLKPKWGYLLCTDGYPTTEGKRIVVRGDYIG